RQGVAWEQVARTLDWINLMTYDFAGSWSSTTGHNAPLYASAFAKSAQTYNGNAAVQAYLAAGVPSEKIVFGVPFYGRGWKEVASANNGLFQKFNGVPQGTRGGGAFDYRDLKKNYLPTFARFWDDTAQVPWLYDATTRTMISYDDPESLARKVEYVVTNKLGGVMIWEISTDDEQGSLINALATRLR
ncbi:MAG: glycoside hydrolase family 18 protein, partial [Anaerolineae bacterium]|nr:glycoside hydrolase family 18 protein [Anaerolineae bacterium]